MTVIDTLMRVLLLIYTFALIVPSALIFLKHLEASFESIYNFRVQLVQEVYL